MGEYHTIERAVEGLREMLIDNRYNDRFMLMIAVTNAAMPDGRAAKLESMGWTYTDGPDGDSGWTLMHGIDDA